MPSTTSMVATMQPSSSALPIAEYCMALRKRCSLRRKSSVSSAAMRRAKYVTEGITVRTITNLDEFASAGPGQESALGEAATELLDIQVGF